MNGKPFVTSFGPHAVLTSRDDERNFDWVFFHWPISLDQSAECTIRCSRKMLWSETLWGSDVVWSVAGFCSAQLLNSKLTPKSTYVELEPYRFHNEIGSEDRCSSFKFYSIAVSAVPVSIAGDVLIEQTTIYELIQQSNFIVASREH